MGLSSHGGERKGQLGPGVTIPMSGLPPKGYPEGSRRVWTPQKETFAILNLSFGNKKKRMVGIIWFQLPNAYIERLEGL